LDLPIVPTGIRKRYQSEEVVMGHIRYVRRAASVMVGIGASWLGLFLCAPSAWALIARPVGSGSSAALSPQPVPSAVNTVVTGGMAGWQIALVAIAAAVFAAALAVLIDRHSRSHRQVGASAA
jgi:hypothetical protein